jgi:hypothetical protein
MAQQNESGRGEQSEFPVDTKPLIRALALLVTAFIGLCAVVYFQSSEETWGIGILLLAAVFCFCAYTQRQDTFRMQAIIVVGLLLCIVLYAFGGGEPQEKEPRGEERTRQPPKGASSAIAPEGFGE